ncbi:MAG: AAA family ATPase [Limnothrix sp. CACIAM 69d]|nr:MAG: AAA family ATPase [Limnothrix sp. CACIAM 69d]
MPLPDRPIADPPASGLSKVRLILLIGPPGCGKSTLARQWQAAAPDRHWISTDAIRAELFGDAAVQGDWSAIWQVVCDRLQTAIANAADAVYDATNADPRQRQRILETARELGFNQIIGWWVQTPLEQCLAWNAQRDRQVPAHVIERMAQQLDQSPPELAEGFDQLETMSLTNNLPSDPAPE